MTTTATNREQKELPAGWKWVKLGDVCEFVNGKTFRQSDWATDGYPIIRIQNLNNHDADFNYWAGSLEKQIVVNRNDLLLAWSGTPGTSFGAHIWNRDIGVLNQHIFRVSIDEGYIQKQFALRAINFHLGTLIDAAHGGVGLRHVTKREVQNLSIPLPPLEEQKRIAEILNEQMAAVEEAKKAAQERLEAAKALPAAYLREVFEGEEAQGWSLINIGDEKITTLITDGTHSTPSYTDEGIPFLSVKDLTGESISFEDCRYISTEEHEQLIKRCHPKLGDVLYTKVGTTGVAKVVDAQRPFSIFVSVALIKLAEGIESRYLEYALNSPLGKLQAKELTQGMANKNLVIRDIKAIKLPIAPIDTQRLVVKELDDKIAGIKLAESSIQQELDTIEAMPAAFIGTGPVLWSPSSDSRM